MEESWEDLLCRVYYAGYEDRQRERDYDPMGNEVVDAARIRAETMERRIRELEALLTEIEGLLHQVPFETLGKQIYVALRGK